MGLIRLLLIGILLWVIYRLVKRFVTSAKMPQKRTQQDQPAAMMVRCRSCGLHIPKHEAIERNGNNYCCIEHSKSDT